METSKYKVVDHWIWRSRRVSHDTDRSLRLWEKHAFVSYGGHLSAKRRNRGRRQGHGERGGDGAACIRMNAHASRGMMFQNPDLQFCMDTVNGELAFASKIWAKTPRRWTERYRKRFLFCGIGHLRDRAFHTLSGGEKQKVMLACTVLIRPRWLLLDETVRQYRSGLGAGARGKSSASCTGNGHGIVAVDHQLAPWLPIMDEAVLPRRGRRAWAAGASLPRNLPEYGKRLKKWALRSRDGNIAAAERTTHPGSGAYGARLCAGYDREKNIGRSRRGFYKEGRCMRSPGPRAAGKSTFCHLVPYCAL